MLPDFLRFDRSDAELGKGPIGFDLLELSAVLADQLGEFVVQRRVVLREPVGIGLFA